MNPGKKDNQFERIMSLTQVIRYPDHRIYTFGDTDFSYKIISSDQVGGSTVRSGKLKCKTPVIVVPETFMETFQGFSPEAVDFARRKYGDLVSKVQILGYQFTHTLESENPYSENARQVVERVEREIFESKSDIALLVSPNDLWEIALVKIILDVLRKSAHGNFEDLRERGFFLSEDEKRENEIEILFSEAINDKHYVNELAERLREYNLFEKYEDRFFQLFKKY
ncbi:MAG: hypothetical protein OEV78_11035 [Spirochaetia bacterium]|nr:hypothetical protein [Spirochaetia bacterium]